MNNIENYEESKHPDSDIDYGRHWGDRTHEETTILTSTSTDWNGDPVVVESLVTSTVIDEKGWLEDGEYIVLSDWYITSDMEDPVTLYIGEQGTGISGDRESTSVFLVGGTPGVQYKLTNSIQTLAVDFGVVRKESKFGILCCSGD